VSAITELWSPSSSIRCQDTGTSIFEPVDQHPGSDVDGFYRGFSTSFRFRPGKGNWFHFPIPTPSVIDGKSTELKQLSLVWEADENTCISWVTANHGGIERLELSPEGVSIQGKVIDEFITPHNVSIKLVRTDFTLKVPMPVSMGVQLSVYGEAQKCSGTLRFYSAGAAFQEK